ncbi:hypothetical protein AMTRI_Chr04g251110 [Amborella trichopoda]
MQGQADPTVNKHMMGNESISIHFFKGLFYYQANSELRLNTKFLQVPYIQGGWRILEETLDITGPLDISWCHMHREHGMETLKYV